MVDGELRTPAKPWIVNAESLGCETEDGEVFARVELDFESSGGDRGKGRLEAVVEREASLRLSIRRSTTAMLPCLPTAPYRFLIP